MNTNRNEADINWNRIVGSIQSGAVKKMKIKWAYMQDPTSHSKKAVLFVISFDKTDKFVLFWGDSSEVMLYHRLLGKSEAEISEIYPQKTGIVLPYADVHENEIQETLLKLPLKTSKEKETAQSLVHDINNIGRRTMSEMSEHNYLIEVVDLLETKYKAEKSAIDRFRSQLS